MSGTVLAVGMKCDVSTQMVQAMQRICLSFAKRSSSASVRDCVLPTMIGVRYMHAMFGGFALDEVNEIGELRHG